MSDRNAASRSFGTRLKKWRQARNMSQTELADQLKVHQSVVCRIEKEEIQAGKAYNAAKELLTLESEGDSLQEIVEAVSSSAEFREFVRSVWEKASTGA